MFLLQNFKQWAVPHNISPRWQSLGRVQAHLADLVVQRETGTRRLIKFSEPHVCLSSRPPRSCTRTVPWRRSRSTWSGVRGKTWRAHGNMGRTEVCSLARTTKVVHEVQETRQSILRYNVLTYRTCSSSYAGAVRRCSEILARLLSNKV